MNRDGNTLVAAAVAADGRDRPKKLPHSRSAPAVQQNLVAKNPPPQPRQRHQVYYELIEADNTKKKLEFEVTGDSTPPAGYEFIPIGNPELTALCKDLSRENGLKIYMVSISNDLANQVAVQMTRVGHHFPVSIVEEAQMELGYYPAPGNYAHGHPEPIPESQEEINAQADAAIRDLFPRIPNTDRQEIIDHAFRKGKHFNGVPVVGLSADIPLSRRVQLAVLAHIRHNHTRYDELLRQTTWPNARRTVEGVCLDILVKWRGDEENGRDELETILREVVVISDTEEDDDDDADDSDDEESDESTAPVTEGEQQKAASATVSAEAGMASLQLGRKELVPKQAIPKGPKGAPRPGPPNASKQKSKKALKRERRAERKAAKAAKRTQRGFKRYQAAWDRAVDRKRQQDNGDAPLPAAGGAPGAPGAGAGMARSISHGSHIPVESGHGAPQPMQSRANNEIAPCGPGPVSRHEGTEVDPIWIDGRGRMLDNHMQPDFRNHAHSAHPAASGQRKVIPAGYGPARPHSALLGPTSPVGNWYQDLLVPSIEPPSPGSASMQPQFIRSLPPRKHTRDDSPEHRPVMQHYNPPHPQHAPGYRDGGLKRCRVVAEDEHVMRVPGDYQVLPRQQNRVPPPPGHAEAKMPQLYSDRAMTAAPNYRSGLPQPHASHQGAAPGLVWQGRDTAFAEIPPSPRTRANAIVSGDSVVHPEPVVVNRIPGRSHGPRRAHDDYEIIQVRRPAPDDAYFREQRRATPSNGGPGRRDGPARPFPVERPRHPRPVPHYNYDGAPESRPHLPPSEAIYIRTVEPRGSIPREHRGPVVERLPPTIRDDYGRGQPPNKVYSREIYYEDRRGPPPTFHQSLPPRFSSREPILVEHQQRPSPNLAPYSPRDIPPRRNVIVLE